jgi:uncharacterized protein
MSRSSARLRRILTYPPLLLPCKLAVIVVTYGYLSHVLQTWQDAGIGPEIASTLIICGSIWAVFTLYTRWLEGRAVTEFAAAGAGREWLAGFTIGVVLIALSIAVLAALGAYHVDGIGTAHKLIAPFLDASIAGVFEETLFRGVVFRIAEDWLGSYWAVFISAALFGAAHLFNPNASLLAAMQIAIGAGLLLAAAYLLTRRLWLAIGIHIGWNFAESGIFGAIESGTSEGGLLHSSTSGPDWLSGGGFGPEASPISAGFGFAAALVLLILASRRHLMIAPPWVRARKGATAAIP